MISVDECLKRFGLMVYATLVKRHGRGIDQRIVGCAGDVASVSVASVSGSSAKDRQSSENCGMAAHAVNRKSGGDFGGEVSC